MGTVLLGKTFVTAQLIRERTGEFIRRHSLGLIPGECFLEIIILSNTIKKSGIPSPKYDKLHNIHVILSKQVCQLPA